MRYDTINYSYVAIWLLYFCTQLDDLITTSELLWSFPTVIEGLQVDSLTTQEFIDFQNHWLSANKSMFPDSNADTAEVKLYMQAYSQNF